MHVQKDIAKDRLTLTASDEPWIDVSVPIRGGMLRWPGNPEIKVEQTEHLRRGDLATVSAVSLGVHTGTHVDAPVHFRVEGEGVDAIGFDRLIGPARVLDFRGVAHIGPSDLERHDIRKGERVLFKTHNSPRLQEKDFHPDFTSVTPDGARWLADRGVRTVGIDYLSVGAPDSGPETHHPLLDAGICIIEGLDLARVEPGLYDLICLPLRLEGLDGAPARVVLRKAPVPEAPRNVEGRTS